MAQVLITSPAEYIPDPTKNRPVFNGQMYIGEPDLDPQIPDNQKQVSILNEDGTTTPINQPISISAGGVYVDDNGDFIRIVVDGNYSQKILDRFSSQVYYVDNKFNGEPLTTESDIIIISPDNVDDMKDTNLTPGQYAETKGYHDAGGDGGAKYLTQTPAEFGSTPDGYGDHALANGNIVKLVKSNYFNVKQFGAKGDGVSDDTSSIQAAIDRLALDKGELYFPPGTYIVRKDSPTGGGTTNPDDYALHFYGDDVKLTGVKGATIIKADPSAPVRFVLMRWGALPIVNGSVTYSNASIEGIEFDGSYTPSNSDSPDGNTILWWHSCSDSSISHCYIHGSSQYGIGMQNGGHVNCLINDVVVEDTLADGIDIKNNGSSDKENKMSNVTVRRFGRATNLTTPFAGIDIMGKVNLNNINVSEFGDIGTAAAGIRFKQGESGESRGVGGHYSNLNNFTVKGLSGGDLDPDGVKSLAYGVNISNGQIEGCLGAGVFASQQECNINNVNSISCGNGFQSSNSTYLTNGDRLFLSNCKSRDCTIGFRSETSECNAEGCMSRSNDTGLSLTSGSGSFNWSGGQIANNTTQVSNTGSNNRIRNTSGYRTEITGSTASVDVDTSGIKTVTIPHNLDLTPNKDKCILQHIRTANINYDLAWIRVVATTSTDVTCQVQVASGTSNAGDTASISLTVDNSLI